MTSPLQEFGLPSDVLLWQAVLLTLISFAVGVLGGFVGLALGTMRLPVLLLLGVPSLVAAGTNIAVSTASALAGSVRHLREKRVDMHVALLMGAPSMVGTFIGGFYSQWAPTSLLVLAVGVLVLWQGVELITRARIYGAAEADRRPASRTVGRRRTLAGVGVGFAVGMLGGAVGLILGTVRLPALIRVLRVDPRVAAGTNLLIGFAMGSVGWVGHVARGHVDYPLAALMGTSAVAGSYLGARMTGRVSLDKLVMAIGVVLIAVGALLLVRAAAM